MNILILLRADIACLIIVANLLIFSLIWRKKNVRAKNNYITLVAANLGHVAFGIITVITVNLPTVPRLLNDICHFIFYAFAVLFVAEYYVYILSLIMPKRKIKKHRLAAYIVCSLGLICVPILNYEYVEGEFTNYSTGLGVMICFGMTAVMLCLAVVVVIINKKRIEKSALFAIIPITIVSLILGCTQIFIPEFLYTGCAMTLISINLLFLIENPAQYIQERSYIDYATGLYNRNCYEDDINNLEKRTPDAGLAVVMFDLNHLKYINDKYGHGEGDTQLMIAAEVLQSTLSSADKIYRIGGDEFLAIYSAKISNIPSELSSMKQKCEALSVYTKVPIVIAAGCAVQSGGETLKELIQRADASMYKNKVELKKHSNLPER